MEKRGTMYFNSINYTVYQADRGSAFRIVASRDQPNNKGHKDWDLTMDLSRDIFELTRDGRKVKPNIVNLDAFLPTTRSVYSDSLSRGNIYELLKLMSPKDRLNMYNDFTMTLGCMFGESSVKLSRTLNRLFYEYYGLEILYKIDELNIMTILDRSNSRIVLRRMYEAGKNGKTKPSEMLSLTDPQFRFIINLNKFRNRLLNDEDFIEEEDDRHYSNSPYSDMENIENLTNEDINEYMSYMGLFEKLSREYRIKKQEAKNYFNQRYIGLSAFNRYKEVLSGKNMSHHTNNNINGRNSIYLLAHRNNLDIGRLIEYVYFDCHMEQGITNEHQVIDTLFDYYQMNHDMLSKPEKYPNYLKTKHDLSLMYYNNELDEIEARKFMETVSSEEYMRLRYESPVNDKYIIIVPSDPDDLNKESNSLNHCVRTYTKRIYEGETKVVFMREKENIDAPLLTIEIRDGYYGYDGLSIVQVEGSRRRSPSREEVEFLDEYAHERGINLADRYGYLLRQNA